MKQLSVCGEKEYAQEGERMMVLCPERQTLDTGSRCSGTNAWNVANDMGCKSKCDEAEDCKAYSFSPQTDSCFICPSSARTAESSFYVTSRLSVTPTCEGLPGSGSNGKWKWTNGWSYQVFGEAVFEDVIKYNCDAGYTLGGVGYSEFECNWEGEWVPKVNNLGITADATTCVPNDCTVDLGVGVTSDCGDSISFLESCTASCADGYFPNEATFSCDVYGGSVALQGSLECEPIPCAVDLEAYPGVESDDCGAELGFAQSCDVHCSPYYMATDYLYVGEGWCRPEGCDLASSECQVNGYTKDGLSEEECRAQCAADAECVGIAIGNDDWENRCYVYTSNADSVVPPSWEDFTKEYFSVYTSSGSEHTGAQCYKIIDPDTHALTCGWENDATALGQPVECVCQEPLMDFASPSLVSNEESSILENGQVSIHIQYPQYLENVVLKFDSLEGETTYDESNEAAAWTLSEGDCSQVLERQLSFSELQDVASVSVEGNELSFSLYFTSTETFPHPTEGFPVTRTVVKPLLFPLELASSIELTLDIALHSQIQSISALEFNFLWDDLEGYTTEEVMASIMADLAAQGLNVEVLSVQGSDQLGGFRRALTQGPLTVIVFGGSDEAIAALTEALETQSLGFAILDNAVMLGQTDYTQIVSVTTEYSDVNNADGSSTATIHFSTAINEPWEFTGVYTMEDFSGTAHSLGEVSEGNSCKQGEELICEQQWTLVVEISAEEVCATTEHSFTVNMQSAHGTEVMEEAHVGFDFSVLPNQDQCAQLVSLGEASNVDGVVQVWNVALGAWEEDPSFEIFLDDVLNLQAVFASEIGAFSGITLSNVQASQEGQEVCADCLSEFPEEFEFTCVTCSDIAVAGNTLGFTMRMSSEVFTGYINSNGKPTQLVFTFDLEYVQGAQRRLLAFIDAGGSLANGDTHVSAIDFGLRHASVYDTRKLTGNVWILSLVVFLLVVNGALVYLTVCRRQQKQQEETAQHKLKAVEIIL